MKNPGTPGSLRNKIAHFPDRLKRSFGGHGYLVLGSIIVGIMAALAAAVLKNIVDVIRELPQHFLHVSNYRILYFLLPVAGILLTVLIVRIFFKGQLERGLGSLLYTISKKSSVIEPNRMYSHVITSGITVGLGGSAGLEAPVVLAGSAMGSNLAGYMGLGYKERTLLLACGAAAGISAIFNSPVAGVLFAIEVLLTDVSLPLFIPLLISTATASIVSKILYSGQLFHLITTQWYLDALPFYLLLGVLSGLISVYMTRVALFTETFLEYRKSIWLKALLGGLSLGLFIFVLPPLFGEGYATITELFEGNYTGLAGDSPFTGMVTNGWLIVIFAIALILVKPFAYALTIGSGGNGGIFAPSLFTGALTGFVLAYAVNLTGIKSLQVTNFIAVGMAGIMAGVIHAPLTAIFLIAEITGGYILFVPLMIVSAVSYFISRYFEPYSFYTRKLAHAGLLDPEDKDRNILNQLQLSELLETDFVVLRSGDPFSSLVEAFTQSNRNIYPVIDSSGRFMGVIRLQEVKELLLKPETSAGMTISDVTKTDIPTIDLTEDIVVAVKKFEQSDQWNIPVVSDGIYEGFISRSNLFSHYRRIIKRSSSMA
jgi:CIC family chloride channel protein